jgi:hypothetical protein
MDVTYPAYTFGAGYPYIDMGDGLPGERHLLANAAISRLYGLFCVDIQIEKEGRRR